jgi:hypothetical protein
MGCKREFVKFLYFPQRFACVNMTPLGIPVVPDEKGMITLSSVSLKSWWNGNSKEVWDDGDDSQFFSMLLF